MKILFVSHTANFSKFNRPYMRWFKQHGWTVHYASAGEEPVDDCDQHFVVPLSRSPFSLSNMKAIVELKKIINEHHYDIVHVHTPTGGVVGRLAAYSARKQGTRVMYSAHGFHFYRGAPLLNWLLYYPVEKILSYITDDLVTINDEDYERAKKKLHAKRTHKINGVGVDLSRFSPASTAEKRGLRKNHGYKSDDFLIICVGELNTNKNQSFLIHAFSRLDIPNAKLILVGSGARAGDYKQLAAELNLEGGVDFLGYRHDLDELYKLADVAVSASIREGLGLGLVEAMACGLPVICSNNRGHRGLVKDGRNGILFRLGDETAYIDAVHLVASSADARHRLSKDNPSDAKAYSLSRSLEAMAKIYNIDS